MRAYILAASGWLVIAIRLATDSLRSVTARRKEPEPILAETKGLAVQPPADESNIALAENEVDPRIARIIEEIPRRRMRRFA